MQKKISTSLVASLLLATTNLFSAQSLEPITVTSATKSTQSIKDVTSNIEVITKEDIEAVCTTQISNHIFDMIRAMTEKNQKKSKAKIF